ncbi:hypothetical protein BJY01DRAFT_251972 [Aspergillus pseudoustus]|uniref:Leucine-rich repeat domain-containing protein n=1 Tax=Aspergillus pseudoustus TaxID=1810923 RepID=A0ABR4J8V8_9EURO
MDRLPVELIHLITQFLSTPARAALARASQRYYEMLLRDVYTHVYFDGYPACRFSFFQAIIRRPELAQSVRSLHLEGWQTEDDVGDNTPGYAQQLQDTLDVDLFQKAVREDPIIEREAEVWDRSLDMFNEDAFVALSMPRLTNLRRLAIIYPFGCELFDRVVRPGEGGDPPEDGCYNVVDLFPRLEELHIAWYDTANGINVRRATPFFSIPSLRKVSGGLLYGGAVRQPDTRARISNVTEIDLDNSSVSVGLAAWINLCRGLKSFRYTHGSSVIYHNDFSPGGFGATLAAHAHTLERLWLNMEMGIDVDGSSVWLGSLAAYTALKILCVPACILHNDAEIEAPSNGPRRSLAETVPPTLEVLVLATCEEFFSTYLPAQVEGMLRSKRCPGLKLLVLQTWGNDKWKEKLDGVRQLCGEGGIALRFRYDRFLHSTWPSYSPAGVEPEEADWGSDEDQDGSSVVV